MRISSLHRFPNQNHNTEMKFDFTHVTFKVNVITSTSNQLNFTNKIHSIFFWINVTVKFRINIKSYCSRSILSRVNDLYGPLLWHYVDYTTFCQGTGPMWPWKTSVISPKLTTLPAKRPHCPNPLLSVRAVGHIIIFEKNL